MKLEIARLYCDEGLNLTEVAHRLGKELDVQISSMEVSRIFREAKENGIVRFVFNPPARDGLQKRLIERFPCLQEAVVVVTGSSYSFQQRMLALAAAEYFDQLVAEQPGLKVGISGGNTMHEVVAALPSKHRDIDIYPTALIARGPDLPDHMDQMIIVGDLWKKSGCVPKRAHYATLPPFDSGSAPAAVKHLYDGFRQLAKVRTVWEGMCSVDLVFASLGAIDVPAEYRETRGRTILDLLAEMTIDRDWLQSRDVVGDISHALFDRRGDPLPDEDPFITLGVLRIRALAARYPQKRVVLIAGKYKGVALASALSGGLCNVLITDDETAENLLESRSASGGPSAAGLHSVR